MKIKVSKIDISQKGNDRTVFDGAAMNELADSIKAQGLITPITVRTKAGGRYELIAGERRLRAHRMLGLKEIEASVNDSADLALAMLIENAVRADLDPIDEAAAYARLIKERGVTPAELSAMIGVSTQRIENRLPLLRMIPDAQALVRTGQLTVGYARVLGESGLDGNRQRMALAALRDYERPTVVWFCQVVAALIVEQNQESLFDLPLISGEPIAIAKLVKLPADPAKDKPMAKAGSVLATIDSHGKFWMNAAADWEALGRRDKVRELQGCR